MIALLVAAGVVNYVDRSTLAVANHTIAQEMHFAPWQMGALLSAFAWAYALFQLPIGGDHRPRRPAHHAHCRHDLLVARADDLGHGPNVHAIPDCPARASAPASRRCSRRAPALPSTGSRSRTAACPLGLFNAASSLGPAIAPPLLTAIMLAYGLAADVHPDGRARPRRRRRLVVVLPRPGAGRRAAGRQSTRSMTAISASDAVAGPKVWAELFRIPTTWAMMVGLFGLVYVSWLYVAWLPDYLETVRHVSTERTGHPGGAAAIRRLFRRRRRRLSFGLAGATGHGPDRLAQMADCDRAGAGRRAHRDRPPSSPTPAGRWP